MKMSRNLVVLSFLTLTSMSINASLIPALGGQVVYDTDLDITWLANANLGAGTIYDDGSDTSDGKMTWANAFAWADSLTVGGFTQWRLPTTPVNDPSCDGYDENRGTTGFGCTGSEMGHLYHIEFGTDPGTSYFVTGDSEAYGLFSNIETSDYWSLSSTLGSDSFIFSMSNGATRGSPTYQANFAWAVHDGNIAGVVVPIPAAFWLFGSGLLGLIEIARRNKAA